jgi:hypothetical protein
MSDISRLASHLVLFSKSPIYILLQTANRPVRHGGNAATAENRQSKMLGPPSLPTPRPYHKTDARQTLAPQFFNFELLILNSEALPRAAYSALKGIAHRLNMRAWTQAANRLHRAKR